MKSKLEFVVVCSLVVGIFIAILVGCVATSDVPEESAGYSLPEHRVTLAQGMYLHFSQTETVNIHAESLDGEFVLQNTEGEAISSTPQIMFLPGGETAIGHVVEQSQWDALQPVSVVFPEASPTSKVDLSISVTAEEHVFSYHTEKNGYYWSDYVLKEVFLWSFIAVLLTAFVAFLLTL